MKDYSNFIPNSFGFITKYEIVGDNIHVYTPESKKGKPNVYPATKENIEYFETRLENQYRLIAENKKVLEEYFSNKISRKTYPLILSIVAFAAIIITTILAVSSSLAWLLVLSIALGAIGVTLVTSISKVQKYQEEMNLIEAYLNEKENIEQISKDDPNITKYLSKKTKQLLDNNQKLMQKEMIESTFNTSFLDKTIDASNLKDLKELLLRYKTSISLTEQQQFIIPQSEQKYIPQKKAPKTKKRTK